MEIATMIFSRLLEVLVLVGSAVKVLLKALPVIGLIIFVYLIHAYRDEMHSRRISNSRIRALDNLSLLKLRFFMKFFLTWMGYEEIVSEKEKETGEVKSQREKNYQDDVDILVVKEGIRYAVLVEKKQNGVGNAVFKKLEDAMEKYNCEKGIIINNGMFSKRDQQEAGYGDIELWDRNKLIQDLLYLQGVEDTHGLSIHYYFHNFVRWVWRGG